MNKPNVSRIIANVLLLAASALDLSLATSFDFAYSGKWTHAPAHLRPDISVNDTTCPGIPLALAKKSKTTQPGQIVH